MTLQQRRAVLAIVAPLIFGLVSLAFGRDSNWDLRNYHWYNPYALLTDRYQIDIAPAGLQSFLTPLLDIPWFVLGNTLPAPAIGFLLGAFQSLNLILLYYLAYLLLPIDEPRQRNSMALWVAIVGMCGGGSLGLLGTTSASRRRSSALELCSSKPIAREELAFDWFDRKQQSRGNGRWKRGVCIFSARDQTRTRHERQNGYKKGRIDYLS